MKIKEFFRINLKKTIITIVLFLATIILSFVFMDVPENASIWLFNPLTPIIFSLIPERFIGISSLIPLLLIVIWDYILACIILAIFNKIKNKKD